MDECSSIKTPTLQAWKMKRSFPARRKGSFGFFKNKTRNVSFHFCSKLKVLACNWGSWWEMRSFLLLGCDSFVTQILTGCRLRVSQRWRSWWLSSLNRWLAESDQFGISVIFGPSFLALFPPTDARRMHFFCASTGEKGTPIRAPA